MFLLKREQHISITLKRDLNQGLKTNHKNKFEIGDIHKTNQSKDRSLDLFLTQLKIVMLMSFGRSIKTLLSFRYTKAF